MWQDTAKTCLPPTLGGDGKSFISAKEDRPSFKVLVINHTLLLTVSPSAVPHPPPPNIFTVKQSRRSYTNMWMLRRQSPALLPATALINLCDTLYWVSPVFLQDHKAPHAKVTQQSVAKLTLILVGQASFLLPSQVITLVDIYGAVCMAGMPLFWEGQRECMKQHIGHKNTPLEESSNRPIQIQSTYFWPRCKDSSIEKGWLFRQMVLEQLILETIFFYTKKKKKKKNPQYMPYTKMSKNRS